MAASTFTYYYDVVTSIDFFIKGKKFDQDEYYDLGLNPVTLKQNKYDKNAEQLFQEVTDTTKHWDLINGKEANGAALDGTIFGDLYNNGKSQFYFKNHQNPNVIV